MKAIILAAGKGKRFGNLTKKLPKPLIKIGDLTLIEHNIKLLERNGFTEIIINVSYLSNLIMDFLGNGEKYNIKIDYSIEHPEPLETGGGIQNALGIIGDSPFLVINSDIYTDCELSKINIEDSDLASLIMVENPPHNLNGDFSMIKNRITLKQDNSFTYAGIGIFRPEFFEGITIKNYKLVDILIKHIKNIKSLDFSIKAYGMMSVMKKSSEVKNYFFRINCQLLVFLIILNESFNNFFPGSFLYK